MLRKALRWSIPLAALLGVAAWMVHAPRARAESPLGKAVEAAPAEGLARFAALTPAQREEAVQRTVDHANSDAAKDRDAFAAAGWELVQTPPPDAEIVELDPRLAGTSREPELRAQLASTTARPDQAERLAEIARAAHDEATQVAAVESLGRIGSDEAQRALLELLGALPQDSAARHEIAPLLRPRSLDDAHAAALAKLLDDRALTAVERKQIAFTLSLVGLRDRSALPGSVRDALSQDARALLDQTSRLARLEEP